MAPTQPRVLSGIQPTGQLHLGNYLGAIIQFVALQDEASCYFPLVDLHALTVRPDPNQLREETLQAANLFLACGLDPAKSTIFVQSHVSAHAELAWLLNCVAHYGELQRMTQFKEKAEQQEYVTVGLFDYPVLMAADILLYQADLVPVGDDQKQHLELARDLAGRFNHLYGQTFTVPKPLIREREEGSRIMGLDDPESKMSKTAPSPYNYVALLDDPDTIRDKVMRAVTDSGRSIRYDPEKKAGIANLLTIYSLLTRREISELVDAYAGKGYADLKRDLADIVVESLRPIQETYRRLDDDPAYTRGVLEEGRVRAAAVAGRTLAEVRRKMGLVSL